MTDHLNLMVKKKKTMIEALIVVTIIIGVGDVEIRCVVVGVEEVA